jgi:Glycosyl transferase family 2
MSPPARPSRLVGGIVAYGDGPRVAGAIRSLRMQKLPKGVAWSKIWVVVAPDHVDTVGHARLAARGEPRIEILEEPARRGKSAALAEIFRRADGDLLVLLNGDGVADPNAVRELVRASVGATPPFGIMARPVPPVGSPNLLSGALHLLWGLHDRFHADVQRREEPGHLSDELFALSISRLPPMRPGIINDGAFVASWIQSQAGSVRYAPRAIVRVAIPAHLKDHIEQRRRIHAGHRQIQQESGRRPPTLVRVAIHDPGRAARLIRAELRERPQARGSLGLLVGAELVAGALAGWDAARQRKGYAIWPRVGLSEGEARGDTSPAGAVG